MTVKDIETDMPFRFIGRNTVYISRGNGWYCSPGGYDGDPWCCDHPVNPAPTKFHPMSFIGFNIYELYQLSRELSGERSEWFTDGDRAMVEYEISKRQD